MKCISIACLFLLASFGAVAQNVQLSGPGIDPNKDKCIVAGTVVRLNTGEPLKKATVVLWSTDGGDQSTFAMTDDQGHFLFENLPSGSYSLRVSRNGYVRLHYGQKKPGGPPAALTLAPGQKMTDLLFKLPRTAAIMGRVLDEDGEPLPRVELQVYQPYRRGGKLELARVGSASTNDLGEYRIFDLAPGRYYVVASYHGRDNVQMLAASSPHLLNEAYPLTFYPNATDASKAQPVTLSAGDELSSVDFLLRPAHFVTVKGNVFSAIPGWQGGYTSVALRPRESQLSGANLNLMAQARNKDGGFRLQSVPPGSYYIIATWNDDTVNTSYTAIRELDVGNSGVDGVTLTISRGVDVPGHLSWKEKTPAEAQEIRVSLRPLNEADLYSNSPLTKVKPDGSFLIKNVPEGVYAPQVFTGSWDCYLESVRYGMTNVSNRRLEVHPGSDETLELTMSSRAARVEGMVVDSDLLPAAGVYVVLIPDALHPLDEWKYWNTATTDQNGKFTIRGVEPGNYKAFSWDSDDDFDWYDPELVKPYESKGINVTVTVGDRKSLRLTLIERTKSPPPNPLAPPE